MSTERSGSLTDIVQAPSLSGRFVSIKSQLIYF